MAMFTLSFNFNPFKNKQQNPGHLLPCRSSSKSTIRSSVSFRSPVPPGPGEDKKQEKEENKGDEKKKKMMMKKKGLGLGQQIIFGEVEKLGKGLKECLSPKQKGDWRDLFLMSFSFAVYVYISQKIVCAYCHWMAML